MRERDEVPGEPVAADVAALPRPVGEGAGERTCERAPALGAADIASPVRAHEEERSLDRLEPGPDPSSEGEQVEVQRILTFARVARSIHGGSGLERIAKHGEVL